MTMNRTKAENVVAALNADSEDDWTYSLVMIGTNSAVIIATDEDGVEVGEL